MSCGLLMAPLLPPPPVGLSGVELLPSLSLTSPLDRLPLCWSSLSLVTREGRSERVWSREEEEQVRGVEEEEEEEEWCPGEDRRLARKRLSGSPLSSAPHLPLSLTSPSLRGCVQK